MPILNFYRRHTATRNTTISPDDVRYKMTLEGMREGWNPDDPATAEILKYSQEWGMGYPPLDHEKANIYYSGNYVPDPKRFPPLDDRTPEELQANLKGSMNAWDANRMSEPFLQYTLIVKYGQGLALHADVIGRSFIKRFLTIMDERLSSWAKGQEVIKLLKKRLEKLAYKLRNAPTIPEDPEES